MLVDCAHYKDGRRQHEEPLATGEAAERAAADDSASSGSGLHRPRARRSCAKSPSASDLPPLAVEDAMQAHQRPEVGDYDDGYFLVLHTARYIDETEEVEFGEVSTSSSAPGFVVAVRHGARASYIPRASASSSIPSSSARALGGGAVGRHGQGRRRLRPGRSRGSRTTSRRSRRPSSTARATRRGVSTSCAASCRASTARCTRCCWPRDVLESTHARERPRISACCAPPARREGPPRAGRGGDRNPARRADDASSRPTSRSSRLSRATSCGRSPDGRRSSRCRRSSPRSRDELHAHARARVARRISWRSR